MSDLEKNINMINICSGSGLDRLAEKYRSVNRYQVVRAPGETDAELRKRLTVIEEALEQVRSRTIPGSSVRISVGGTTVKRVSNYNINYVPPIQHIEVTISIDSLKCGCGSEKAKTPGHSTWCPKYEDFKP